MAANLNEREPIFIVGMPRSGTTLMGSLLSAHPAIAIAPESHFLNHWLKQYRHLDLNRRADFELFWRVFSQSERFSYFGLEAEAIKARILAQDRPYDQSIFSVMLQAYTVRLQKQRWGEKTPAHEEYLATLLAWQPQARIIYMLRDPRAVAASLLAVPWGSPYVTTHAARWRRSVRRIARWAGDERLLLVKYEALVTEPEAELRRVCEFVGETYTPAMFKRSEATSPIINRAGWAKTHLQTALQPITPANVDKWRANLSPDQIALVEVVAKRGMLEHGYQPLTSGLSLRQSLTLVAEMTSYTGGRLARRLALTVSPANLKASFKRSHFLVAAFRAARQALRSVSDAGRVFVGSRNGRALRRWPDYLTKQPIAGYIGWLGYANLGDEAMYVSFKQLFPQFQIILANDVQPLELSLYRRLVKRGGFYDFVFLGGGTLINARRYLTALRSPTLRERPLVVFGTGVLDPAFWAAHRPQVDYAQEMAEWIEVLQRAAFIGVRGPQSAAILAAYGLPSPCIIGDPGLALCRPRPPDAPGSRLIALNLGCSGPLWGSQPVLNEIMGSLAHRLLETGWQVEFLPMHPSDLWLGLSLMRTFNLQQVSVWREFKNIPKTLERMRSYHLLVGQRLHSAVLACGSGVPAISLEYRPKCADFMESIDRQRFSLRTDRVDVDRILALIDEINANYIEHCQQMNANCDHLRRLQHQAAAEVLGLNAVEMEHSIYVDPYRFSTKSS